MGEPRRLNLSPLFVALLGVMIGAIILTIYHCVIVGWCNRSRALSRRQQAPPGLRPDRDETPSSLEHSRVDLLPVKKYTKEGKTVGIDEDEAMCSVCLAEFKEGDELRVLPDCDHSFHIECIDMWLSSHSSCPLCRTDATPLLNRTDTISTRQHEINITVPPPQHSINSNTRPVQTVSLPADEWPIGTTFYN